MSPALDFDDVAASGPAPDVWGTLAVGFVVGAAAFVASGIAYAFAFDGARTRDRIEAASELGASALTAGLLLAAALAIWEATRRQGRSRSGITAFVVTLALLVIAGTLYSVWHLATFDFSEATLGNAERNTEWQRTAYILFRLAAGAIAVGTLVIMLRPRATDGSVEVA
jgi:hypothetical protein